jgi:putative ubiquitin-RnfH superfamily antitoxin RatB of RatAB toxin-antitoxin module
MTDIQILIAYASPMQHRALEMTVPLGTTLQQALALQTEKISEWLNGEPVIATGVWARVRPSQYVLREGDRIEIYRALKADPKQARRVRAGKKSVPA